MNGQTDPDDRAQLVVGIGAAVFGAVRKIVSGQPPARVAIEVAHDILDVAGHAHTPNPENPLLTAARAAAAAGPNAGRGADGLTDQERDDGFTAASVLGENINASETMDRTEQTLPVADAASGEGSGSDFTLPAAIDRTVPGEYFAPDSLRPTDDDAARIVDAQLEQDAGRQRHNLGELGNDRELREIEQGADGGKVVEQDPADGGKIAEQDSADGGKVQGADDAPQQ